MIKSYNNIITLLFDMKLLNDKHKYKKSDWLCADTISVSYGWYCMQTSTYFNIPIEDFRSSKLLMSKENLEIFEELFRNRNDVFNLIDNLPIIKKMINLKAFW